MISIDATDNIKTKISDWEVDFYSRPIIEPDGKKRWELLITNTRYISDKDIFRWEKKCPSAEVNSIWLKKALQEAIIEANNQGWSAPTKIRCWRKSMRTMIKRAASQLELEVIPSRRTYNLIEWIGIREREIYPEQDGYMVGPIAPPAEEILNDPIPLPEAIRGDFWSLEYLPIGQIKDAAEWPIEFSGLVPITTSTDVDIPIPGIRLFSKNRSLALAGCLGALEPVRLALKKNQLILETGQEDQWLVTDLNDQTAKEVGESFAISKEKAGGLQFIAIQATQEDQNFAGFWMLKDLN